MAASTGREPRTASRFDSTRVQLARRRRSLLLPILLLVAISLVAAGGVLFWSAGSLNLREAESQEALIGSMVRLRRETLQRLVIDYAWWDEAIKAGGVLLDERWAKEGLAGYLQDGFGITAGWVVAPDNEVRFAFDRGRTLEGDAVRPLPIDTHGLLETTREATSIDEVPPAAFVIHEQDLAVIAASPLAALDASAAPASGPPHVLLFLRPLKLEMFGSSAVSGHIEDLHFVRGPAPPGYLSCPIKGANGQPLGHIVWRDYRPGSQLLWNATPLLLVSLLAVGILLFLAIRRVETAVSSEGRLSASLFQEQQRRSQKSNFVSMVSHELRTPLQAIGMSSDMLERFGDQMTAPERREEARTIRKAVATLARLVEDVLVMGRSEVARTGGEAAQLDLAKLCRAMWREVSIALRSKQDLVLDDQIGEPLSSVNELALHTILSNLMQNAIKYSRGEGPVKVRLARQGREYSIAVTDFGPGIPEAQREAIFQPYWRSKEVGAIAGTGLGLAVARSAAQSIGGDLRLASAGRAAGLDGGTTFVAAWPAGAA